MLDFNVRIFGKTDLFLVVCHWFVESIEIIDRTLLVRTGRSSIYYYSVLGEGVLINNILIWPLCWI